MKYYLSAAAQETLPDEALLVKINNVRGKTPRRASINQSYVVAQPDQKEIVRLNTLASKSPFCSTHKAKKYDTL